MPRRRVGHRPDRLEDRSAQDQGDRGRDDHRPQQAQAHQADRRGRGRSGAGALVLHVLLVDVEHRVGLALDVLERRQELGEVEPRPLRFRLGRQGEEAVRQVEIPGVEPRQRVGHRLLAGQGHVVLLDLQVPLEHRPVLGELLARLLLLATDREQQRRIHSLQRLLHPLGGQDASVVLPEDHVDVVPQPGKHDDRPHPQADHDGQQGRQPDQQPGSERPEHGSCRCLLISMARAADGTPSPSQIIVNSCGFRPSTGRRVRAGDRLAKCTIPARSALAQCTGGSGLDGHARAVVASSKVASTRILQFTAAEWPMTPPIDSDK